MSASALAGLRRTESSPRDAGVEDVVRRRVLSSMAMYFFLRWNDAKDMR